VDREKINLRSSSSQEWHIPAVLDGHDAGFPEGNLLERLDGEEEVVVGRVAVAAGVGGEAVVGGAEVGGRDDDGGAGETILEILDALDLVAAAARRAALEQRRAQPHRRHPVPVLAQIPETARPTCTPHREAENQNTLGRTRIPLAIHELYGRTIPVTERAVWGKFRASGTPKEKSLCACSMDATN